MYSYFPLLPPFTSFCDIFIEPHRGVPAVPGISVLLTDDSFYSFFTFIMSNKQWRKADLYSEYTTNVRGNLYV